MQDLVRLLINGEEWMSKCVYDHVKAHGYMRYISTPSEMWRLSVRGLSQALIETIALEEDLREWGPDEDDYADPVAIFAMEEAQLHRERGVSLAIFQGIFKLYRRTFRDYLFSVCTLEQPDRLLIDSYSLFMDSCLDRAEIAFCNEWSVEGTNSHTEWLENSNRIITNEKNTYLSVFESLVQPVIILREDGAIQNLNYQAVQLIDQGCLVGSAYLNIVRERWSTVPPESATREDDEASGRFCGLSLQNLFPWIGDIDALTAQLEQSDGAFGFECVYESPESTRHFEGQISRMLDKSEQCMGTLLVFNDITERKLFAKHLEVLATTDALTGVRNRLSFLEKSELEFERARRYERELSVMVIDADRFKRINDTFGHHVGDKVLKALTNTITDLLRANDLCGRMGGEEFAVVLPEAGGDSAYLVAERLCQELRRVVVQADSGSVSVTVSVGVATIGAEDNSVEDLLKRADLAMYEAKAGGRNRIAAA